MWLYIIGCIVCLILSFFICKKKYICEKFTYEVLITIIFISLFSWFIVFFEIILIAVSYLDAKDFWSKEVFKKK